jgi:hypothetical protein
MVRYMKRRFSDFRAVCLLVGLPAVVAGCGAMAERPAAAVAAFNMYTAALELRLDRQHGAVNGFIAGADAQSEMRLRRGEPIVERISPPAEVQVPGALLHRWRGTAFAPGAKATDFEQVIKDFNAYPQTFAPQVVRASVLAQEGDRMQASMRVRQKHGITVVMDSTYDVSFGRFDAKHGWSVSKSTRISEIGSPGTPSEHALSSSEDHGFLWRLNTYWSYEERDGGLYMQIETVSLSRSIPTGLGWVVGPFVESVPRESLEFTLRAVCNALGTRR